MKKEQTYLLRNVPMALWKCAKYRAISEDTTLRELLLKALREYLRPK